MRINAETGVGIFVLGALAIFFYMTFQIGVFRLDTSSYRPQTVYFHDVSGLARKADVKIAGVKVGWVDAINLVQGQETYQAVADIMVNKQYALRSDAYAVVRQDGLLGVKYLEIMPGDPLLPTLKSGQALGTPGKAPVSIDELLQQFKKIASNVEDVTSTIRDSLAGEDSKAHLREMFENLHKASERISTFSEGIDRIVNRNESDVNAIIGDLREVAHELRTGFPPLQDDLRRIAQKLEMDVLPSFQTSVEKIAKAFDRDFDKVANKLETTADAIELAALQTRDGFKSIGAVADKINEGKGLLGKLVNDEQTYQDLKTAVQGLKNYFAKIEGLGVVFDAHSESMYRPTQDTTERDNYIQHDNKGYFTLRVHPSEDRFYVFELMGTTKGKLSRVERYRTFYNQNQIPYNQTEMNISDSLVLFNAPHVFEVTRVPNSLKWGIQFGKIFKDIAFRFGIFEDTPGVGIDYDIPFGTDKFRWVTTFEAFDATGSNHIEFTPKGFILQDQRPHLKWLNRIFVMRNFYFAFGADDFVSKHNACAFFGVGLRFGDDDLKYLMSRVNVLVD